MQMSLIFLGLFFSCEFQWMIGPLEIYALLIDENSLFPCEMCLAADISVWWDLLINSVLCGLSGVDLQDKVRTQGRDPEKAMASGSQRRKTKKKGARNWGLQPRTGESWRWLNKHRVHVNKSGRQGFRWAELRTGTGNRTLQFIWSVWLKQ